MDLGHWTLELLGRWTCGPLKNWTFEIPLAIGSLDLGANRLLDPLNLCTVGPFEPWGLYAFEDWASGLLGRWAVGQLVHWAVGPVDLGRSSHWFPRPLELCTVGPIRPLDQSAVGQLGL